MLGEDSNNDEGTMKEEIVESTTAQIDDSVNKQHEDQEKPKQEATATSTAAAATTTTEAATTTEIIPKVVTPPELPLEWTKLAAPESSNARPIRYPSDVMEFAKDETYLEIIGTAGQKITHMGKDLMRQVSPNITHLVLRSHLVEKMEGIRGMKNLELLELYDNQIEYLEELDGDGDGDNNGNGNNSGNGTGFNLKTLDMSYNVIRSMEPVICCPNLVELYLANNKIKSIEGLSSLVNLRKIDLGANRIRTIDETQFSNLIHLEELWLGKNKIESIQGISKLTKLKRLDVQSNRLTSINGLIGQIHSLEELYLAHNGINDDGAMEEDGLQLQFTNLTTLDLSKNRLTSCKPFCHLDTLNELWLSQNDISTFEDVEPISRLGMRDGAELKEIYLEHNPIYKDFEYRKRLKEMIPSLIQIDANMINGTGYGSSSTNMGSNNGIMTPQAMMEQMRLLQEKAISKAKLQEEEESKAKGLTTGTDTTDTASTN